MQKRFRDYLSYHPLYRTWSSMKSRCLNPNHKDYDHYGGKGVTICERWFRFKNFLEDMGPKPSPKHTLDRIDSNGCYEPSNCRWASTVVQAQNTSRVKKIEINGEVKCFAEWCRQFQINKHTARQRMRVGWTAEAAITTPVRKDGRSRRSSSRRAA